VDSKIKGGNREPLSKVVVNILFTV